MQPRPELLSITGIHCCVHIRNGALQREARRAPCRTQVISCGNLILCVCQSDFQKVLNRPPRQNSLSPIIRFTKPDNRTQNPIIRLVETGCKQIRENNKSALDKSSASPLRIGRLLSYCPPCRWPRYVLFSVNRFLFPYFVSRTLVWYKKKKEGKFSPLLCGRKLFF